MKTIAMLVVLAVAVPAYAADPSPAVQALVPLPDPSPHAADLPVADVPRNPSLELNVHPAVVDGQSLVCMDPADAITWTRGARSAELERDSCVKREEDARGFNAKWFFAGAGIGVAAAAVVGFIVAGVQAAAKKSP